ncbi:MAG: ATP-binding cassette domain-containing protein [Chloroflexi bacterium]|nr:ATP-binding cassette domain-containing protein [Chloroflexota bacterium]
MLENYAIELRGVVKQYAVGEGVFTALNAVHMQVQPGEFIGVVGKSGSGKSTLINMITGIDNPTAGDIHILSTNIQALSGAKMATWRGRHIGLIFQFFQLLPTLTVLENVIMPMAFCKMYRRQERSQRALALLERLGVADQAGKRPLMLSGGQQQRVAIARALANDPLF